MQARLIQYFFPNQAENLAAEEAIAIAVQSRKSPPAILVWKNNNAVVLGKFQCWRNEIALSNCERHSTTILRRFSGGGTVFQDLGNLNISFALPLKKGKSYSAGFGIQKRISELLRKTVASLGVPTVPLPQGGIGVYGKKISGFAGVIKPGLVFSHYTLLISTDLKKLSEVLDPKKNKIKGCVRSHPSPVANLNDIINEPVNESSLISNLMEQFQREMGIEVMKSDWHDDEVSTRLELTVNKHSTNEWVFWR
ncbi:MAG: biotin/lipoate A/B protein ligase family protein [Candidatus Hodarchaeota archaeon]